MPPAPPDAGTRPAAGLPASPVAGLDASPAALAVRRLLILVSAAALVLVSASAAQAQGRQLSFIRDTEIEVFLRDLSEPIFRAAGLTPGSIDMFIVDAPSLNAFVAGGQNMFFHTGFLRQADSVSEVIGVIAHETGHIAGGHIARGSEAVRQAQTTAILSTLLGLAAAVATGNPGVGVAGIAAGQQVASRDFLAFTRQNENAADQAALTYLDRVGWSPEGLLRLLERLEDQELLPASQQVEYIRTHPLTRDRVDTVRAAVARSPHTGTPPPPRLEERFQRIRAKLNGFLQPVVAIRQYRGRDDIPARYGLALAQFRRGNLDEAIGLMRGLITAEPDNPHFQEMLGQILLENGRLAEARPHYEAAVAALPREPLLRTTLGQIKLDAGGPDDIRSAIADLELATGTPGGQTSVAWRLLATAYGRVGREGEAFVALAEEALDLGRWQEAEQQAERALRVVPAGSATALRARDIQSVAQREAEDDRRRR